MSCPSNDRVLTTEIHSALQHNWEFNQPKDSISMALNLNPS